MTSDKSPYLQAKLDALSAENADLRIRLEEAEEILQAIRSGSIDAVVVGDPGEPQVYTLRGADHPYRVFVESMKEGAVTLSDDLTILYCNQAFARLVKTPTQKVIGVYIVEAHDVVREGYIMFLEMIGDMFICGAVATAEEALEEIPELSPDIVLVDISLPGMNGLTLIKLLRARSPGLRLLVISGHDETQYTEPARKAGADGFVRKGNPDRILDAVQLVLDGGQYFPPVP